jgi:ATP adenylyltransferase
MNIGKLIQVSENGDRITLDCGRFTPQQRAWILAQCEQNLQEILTTPNTKAPPDCRPPEEPHADPDCVFCHHNIKPRIIEELGSAVAIMDAHPVTQGHVLVIPRRHVSHYFLLTHAERRDADDLLQRLYEQMARDDDSITGYNVGVNCGESAGQTIFHVHYHLFPRRFGDTDNPRGGVRGAIRGKRNY